MCVTGRMPNFNTVQKISNLASKRQNVGRDHVRVLCKLICCVPQQQNVVTRSKQPNNRAKLKYLSYLAVFRLFNNNDVTFFNKNNLLIVQGQNLYVKMYIF